MVVTIGIDPHKGSHTAVALDEHEATLGQLRVRSALRPSHSRAKAKARPSRQAARCADVQENQKKNPQSLLTSGTKRTRSASSMIR